MKIFSLSDTHLELHRDGGKSFAKSLDPTGIDVLIAAGDIMSLSDPSPLYRLCDRFKDAKVLYVNGNHEYWKQSVDEALENLGKLSHPNLTVLNSSSVEIDGRTFHGTTLWFNEREVLRCMPDFHNFSDFMVIGGFNPWVFRENEKNAEWLKKVIRKNDVVITHHLPSFQCVSDQFQGNPSNCFFASDQDDTIYTNKPSLWFFGHTHSSVDVVVGDTRMVCNPFGYIHALNPDFNQDLRIEL